MRLAGSTLLIFAHEPSANSAHMSPIEQYPLCPPDSVAIVSPATQAEVGSVAKSDVPFIIKAGTFQSLTLSYLNILVNLKNLLLTVGGNTADYLLARLKSVPYGIKC